MKMTHRSCEFSMVTWSANIVAEVSDGVACPLNLLICPLWWSCINHCLGQCLKRARHLIFLGNFLTLKHHCRKRWHSRRTIDLPEEIVQSLGVMHERFNRPTRMDERLPISG